MGQLHQQKRDGETRRQKAQREFFKWVHSSDGIFAGIDLAIFLQSRPNFARGIGCREHEGPEAVFAWPATLDSSRGGRSFEVAWVPVSELSEAHLRALQKGLPSTDVVLARPGLPKSVWDVLNQFGYYREIPGEEFAYQLYGWSAETRQEALTAQRQQVAFSPTIGLLPCPGKRVEQDRCLLLVEVNYQWLVLSEIGLHGRTGGSRLLRGEPIYFVVDRASGGAIYRLDPEGTVDCKEIEQEWGGVVEVRAREDGPSPVVRAKLSKVHRG